MFATATLTSKGQTTIPVKLRKNMGIKQGDKLVFRELEDGLITLERAKSLEERLAAVRPHIDPKILERTSKMTVREMLESYHGQDF